MPDSGDLLLYALSCRGKTSWGVFTKIFDELYITSDRGANVPAGEVPNFERLRAVLILSSLGHCDVDFSVDRQIYMAPASLAALPSVGLPQAVLCGARGPDTIREIRKACAALATRVRVEVQHQGKRAAFAPSRTWLEGESSHALQRLATHLGINYAAVPAAWSIAAMSGSIDEYPGTLQWSRDREINWQYQDFLPKSLRFQGPFDSRDEVRLTRYKDPVRFRWTYRLWCKEESAEVNPSWGRYSVLRTLGLKVLCYDPESGIVAVPSGAPLPILLARALSLCSGYASKFVPRTAVVTSSPESFGFRLYTSVPRDVFASVASKVSQGSGPHLVLREEGES